MNVTVYCDEAALVETARHVLKCSDGWQTTPALLPFNLSQIDPSIATQMFGAGFSLFLVPWISAFGFSQLLKMLRH